MNVFQKIIFKIQLIAINQANRLYQNYANYYLKQKEFTIICNNCYGGHMYQALNRSYNTPTVGLYFFAEDYINFVSNLDAYLNEELTFVSETKYREAKAEHSRKKYPIGILSGGLEIHFLHYKSKEEAKQKWNRRKQRVDTNSILIVMNDQNRFENNLMSRFDKLNYPKIFLSALPRKGENVKVIDYYKGKSFVGDMYNDKLKVLCSFDLVKWIKNQ